MCTFYCNGWYGVYLNVYEKILQRFISHGSITADVSECRKIIAFSGSIRITTHDAGRNSHVHVIFLLQATELIINETPYFSYVITLKALIFERLG